MLTKALPLTRNSNGVIALRTMLKNRKLIPFVLLAVLIVAAFSLRAYFVRDDSGGEFLWNGDEAYLFMSVTRRGYKIGYWEYPLALLKEALYGVRGVDDQRTSVTIIHIRNSGIERHVVEALYEEPANTPDFYTPCAGSIYANYHGSLIKWTGNKFETATEEERRRLDGTNRLDEKNMEKGWSKRGFGEAVSDYQFAVNVSQVFRVEVTNKRLDRAGHSTLSIDLARPGQAPQNIWHVDGRTKWVSRTEYKHAVARRQSALKLLPTAY
jgi:hypothetical protein